MWVPLTGIKNDSRHHAYDNSAAKILTQAGKPEEPWNQTDMKALRTIQGPIFFPC
jgi:hypothetical protein